LTGVPTLIQVSIPAVPDQNAPEFKPAKGEHYEARVMALVEFEREIDQYVYAVNVPHFVGRAPAIPIKSRCMFAVAVATGMTRA
jgi:hypothetical protein